MFCFHKYLCRLTGTTMTSVSLKGSVAFNLPTDSLGQRGGTKCLDEESYIQGWEFKCSRFCHCKIHFVPSLITNFIVIDIKTFLRTFFTFLRHFCKPLPNSDSRWVWGNKKMIRIRCSLSPPSSRRGMRELAGKQIFGQRVSRCLHKNFIRSRQY